jgi:hypothetical protein
MKKTQNDTIFFKAVPKMDPVSPGKICITGLCDRSQGKNVTLTKNSSSVLGVLSRPDFFISVHGFLLREKTTLWTAKKSMLFRLHVH